MLGLLLELLAIEARRCERLAIEARRCERLAIEAPRCERLAIEARRVHRLIRGMPHGVGGGSSPSALQSYDLSLLGGLLERLPLLTDLLADGALEGSAKGLACFLAVAAARAEFM